jgi:hypothetical protein
MLGFIAIKNSGFPILPGNPEYVPIFPAESSCCWQILPPFKRRRFAIKVLEVWQILKYYVASWNEGDVRINKPFIIWRIYATHYVLEVYTHPVLHLHKCLFHEIFRSQH